MSAEYWPAAKGSCETYGKYIVTLASQKNTIVRKMNIPYGYLFSRVKFSFLEQGRPNHKYSWF